MLRQLVICDFNGVLGRKVLARDDDFRRAASSAGAPLLTSCRGLIFLPRPGAIDFVRALLKHDVDVAIWSTMREDNVRTLCREMFGEFMYSRLAFVRGSSDPAASKNVSLLPFSLTKDYGERIIIIDDTADKIRENRAGSWIVAKPFGGDPHEADISWMYHLLRAIGDAGISLPMSISESCSQFFATTDFDAPDETSTSSASASASLDE